MENETGMQCPTYHSTGHACPGCEQCAPLSVQAKNEVPMRLPADLHLDLRDAVAVARQRAEKLGNAAMKKRWDAVDERLYAMSLSAAPAAQVQAQPEPHQWTLDTIGGAIAYGRMGATPPPSPEHWLNEYWQIGRQLAKLDETSAWDNVTPADAAAQAQPVAGEERAAFEHHEHASDLTRNPDGSLDDYANPCVQSAWDGWQARAALAAAQPAAASERAPMDMSTDEAREYLVKFMEQHFTDKTFHRYIRGQISRSCPLAGDFAWQMARALQTLAANKPAAPAAATDQRSLQIIAGCATDDLSDIRAELGLSDEDCIDAVLEHIRELKGSAASAAQPGAEPVRAVLEFMLAYENDDPAATNEIQTAFDQQSAVTDGQEFARCYVARMMKAALAAPTAPIAAAVPEVSAAAHDVLAERQRQISVEGRTPDGDAAYTDGQLARAAACYASINSYPTPSMWPWAPEWWKPTTYRRNLVKAAALLLAEIERIDRATPNS